MGHEVRFGVRRSPLADDQHVACSALSAPRRRFLGVLVDAVVVSSE